MSTDTGLQFLLDSAKNHGDNDDPDHEVGDLQDFLSAMWGILTPEQRRAYFDSEEVLDILSNGKDEDEMDEFLALIDQVGAQSATAMIAVPRGQIRVQSESLPDEPTACAIARCVYLQNGICDEPQTNRRNSDATCHKRPVRTVFGLLTPIAPD